jgi:hypothetical protein
MSSVFLAGITRRSPAAAFCRPVDWQDLFLWVGSILMGWIYSYGLGWIYSYGLAVFYYKFIHEKALDIVHIYYSSRSDIHFGSRRQSSTARTSETPSSMR